MKLANLVDLAKIAISNGVSIDDSRFDDLALEEKIHSARAIVIANRITVGERINPAWIQKVDITAVERDVERGVVHFECPTAISVDGMSNGFVYVGGTDGISPFISLGTGRTNLSVNSKLSKMREIFWKLEVGLQNNTTIACYNNPKLEDITIEMLANNPTEVPGYRKDVDEYPIDARGANEIVEMLAVQIIGKMRMPPDYINDGTDKTK